MIYNYPFLASQFARHPRSKVYYPSSYTKTNSVGHSLTPGESKKNILHSEKKSTSSDVNRTDEKEVFEIFGIKLYFDDILLICLIFFLYNEGIQDQFLFIILILLLLT